MPSLDLTSFDEPQGFDALDPGKYFVTVFDAEDRETAGGEGAKMPEGTPYIWLHFMITGKVGEDEQGEDSPAYNRRVFRNLVIPPADYDEKKAKTMRGMIVSFFRAVGFTDEEITSGDFSVDTEDLIEKTCVVQLNRKYNKYTKEYENNIVSFLSVAQVEGEESASASGVL